jgi:hypothetical protein
MQLREFISLHEVQSTGLRPFFASFTSEQDSYVFLVSPALVG